MPFRLSEIIEETVGICWNCVWSDIQYNPKTDRLEMVYFRSQCADIVTDQKSRWNKTKECKYYRQQGAEKF